MRIGFFFSFDDAFDIGTTEKIIQVLREYNIKATFFCIGENIEKYPDLFALIDSEGHAIGNHGYRHVDGWTTDTNDYIENVIRAKDVIPSFLYRPPYGKIKRSQAKILMQYGFKIVMWDTMSWDFDKGISSTKVIDKVINNVKSGSIIVFHDNPKVADKIDDVLPIVIENLQSKGFLFDKIN
ncbi:MAG: polysaccharide deacetylase family protein [Saprospiraceae bacterium]